MYTDGRLSIGNPGVIEIVRTMNKTETQFADKAREAEMMNNKSRPKHTHNCSRTESPIRVKRRVNAGTPFSHMGVLLKCPECGRLGKNPVKMRKSEK